MKKLLLLVAASLALAGCATNMGSASVNDFGRYLELRKGESRKRDVFQQFGQPHEVQHISETSESLWSYYSIKERMNVATFVPFVGLLAGGNDVNSNRADFFFNKDGYFIKTERTEKASYQNQWVGMARAFDRTGQVEEVRKEMAAFGLPFDERLAKENAGNANISGH